MGGINGLFIQSFYDQAHIEDQVDPAQTRLMQCFFNPVYGGYSQRVYCEGYADDSIISMTTWSDCVGQENGERNGVWRKISGKKRIGHRQFQSYWTSFRWKTSSKIPNGSKNRTLIWSTTAKWNDWKKTQKRRRLATLGAFDDRIEYPPHGKEARRNGLYPRLLTFWDPGGDQKKLLLENLSFKCSNFCGARPQEQLGTQIMQRMGRGVIPFFVKKNMNQKSHLSPRRNKWNTSQRQKPGHSVQDFLQDLGRFQRDGEYN